MSVSDCKGMPFGNYKSPFPLTTSGASGGLPTLGNPFADYTSATASVTAQMERLSVAPPNKVLSLHAQKVVDISTRLEAVSGVISPCEIEYNEATQQIAYKGYQGTLSTGKQHFSFRQKINVAMRAIEVIERIHKNAMAHLHISLDSFVWKERGDDYIYVAVTGLESASDLSTQYPLPKSFAEGLYPDPAASAPELCTAEKEYSPKTVQECFSLDIYALGFHLFQLFMIDEERPQWAKSIHPLLSRTRDARKAIVEQMSLFTDIWNFANTVKATSNQKAQIICTKMMAMPPGKRLSLKEAKAQFQSVLMEYITLYEVRPKSFLEKLQEKPKPRVTMKQALQNAYFQNALTLVATRQGQRFPERHCVIQQLYFSLQTQLQRSFLPFEDALNMSLELMLKVKRAPETATEYNVQSTGHTILLRKSQAFVLAIPSDPVFAKSGSYKKVMSAVFFDFSLPELSFSGVPVVQAVCYTTAQTLPQLIQEITNLRSLEGAANVIQLLHDFAKGNQTILIYKKYEGALRDFLDFPDRFSVSDRFEAALEAISGLTQMHTQGVCHFDITLDNLLYQRTEQKTIHTVVSDLGFSVDFSVGKKQQFDEQCRGMLYRIFPKAFPGEPEYTVVQNSLKTDIYALGYALYHLFATQDRLPQWGPLSNGKADASGRRHATMLVFEKRWKELSATKPSDPILQAQIICARMMAIEPRDRLPLSLAHAELLSIYNTLI